MNNYFESGRVAKNYLNTNTITEAIGIESMQAAATQSNFGSTDTDAKSVLGSFSPASDTRCLAIIDKYIKPMLESAYVSNDIRIKDFWTNASLGITNAAKTFTKDPQKFAMLPEDVRKLLGPVQQTKHSLESAMSKMTGDDTGAKMKVLEFKKDQCTVALESMLFNHFANLFNKKIASKNFGGAIQGLESYNYQNAIYYPKLEALSQWVNTTATIYPKLAKIKQVVNEIATIPVHTQEIRIRFKDGAGNIVNDIPREELYSYMSNPKVPQAYTSFTRTMVLDVADFGIDIVLYKDILTGSTVPFTNTNELVRSDIRIMDLEFDDGTHSGEIFEPQAGKMQAVAINEMAWKGEMIKVFSKVAGKETEYYYITPKFDGSEQLLVFAQASKSDPALPDIAKVTFEFKIRDRYLEEKATTEFFLQERRGMITPGPINRLDIPLSQTELDALDQRLNGSFLNKITNLASEYISHDKDYKWFSGHMAMKSKLIADYQKDPKFQIYASQDINLNIPGQVNKKETLNMYLGQTFSDIRQKFNVATNSQFSTQLNIFCHTYHLSVIDPVVKHITGTVDEETNGALLGIAQDARTHVLTLGESSSAPVTSIVVSTDKMDSTLLTTALPTADPQDINYFFHVVPRFKETNLETTMFVETATRVISDNGYRSNRRPNVPAMFMEYSSKFETLRAAAGDINIKGHYSRAIP